MLRLYSKKSIVRFRILLAWCGVFKNRLGSAFSSAEATGHIAFLTDGIRPWQNGAELMAITESRLSGSFEGRLSFLKQFVFIRDKSPVNGWTPEGWPV